MVAQSSKSSQNHLHSLTNVNQLRNSYSILLDIDEKMGWERQPTVLLEITKALVHCEPRDLETNGFETMRLLAPRIKSWNEVKAVCQELGRVLAERATEGSSDAP